MSCIPGLLRQVGAEVEAKLKPQLRGFAGVFIAGYLPQAWVFVTDGEVTTFIVDKQGDASVVEGRADGPDVTIETSHAILSSALQTRNPSAVPAGSVKVTQHTPKGKTAYGFLRERLGL